MIRAAFLPFALLAAPALAQEDSPPEIEGGLASDEVGSTGGHEIVVIAERLRGQIDAPQKPVAVYNEEDIVAYGASSIGDLISAVSPQTGSGRGRGGGFPVILLNGQRISNFREMRNIPPEAIRRMEVLPEEVALRFGYSPDQRVINFILKDNFAVKSIDAEYHFPTRGGFDENQFEGTLLKIDKASRLNLYVRANDASMLTEAERGVIQQPGSPEDSAQYRSLIPDTRDLIFNASWSRGLGEKGTDGSIGLNLGYVRNDNLALTGLNSAELAATGGKVALTRRIGTDTFQGGANVNKPIGSWQLTATLDASHVRTATDTDRNVAQSAGQTRDRAVSKVDSATTLLTFAGRPFRMPAGDASATLKAGFAYTGIDSEDTRTNAGPTRLRRGNLNAGINLALPLTSRKEGVLSGVGDISLNLSAGLDRLSDFGTLKDWSAGLTWEPTAKLSLQASYLVNQSAPSLSDLGNPTTVTANVPVYDFLRGETALVAVTGGGNPNLRREQQRDLKFSATWQLPVLRNSNLLIEYFRNRSSEFTSAFPLLVPAIEAAFPDRIVRDAEGRLVAIDRRSVTLAGFNSTRLRWGLNLSGSLGKAPAERAGGGVSQGEVRERGGPPGASGVAGRGGPGGGPRLGGRGLGPMAAMMGGGGRGRWNLSIFHTLRIEETVLVAPGGPQLNLLDGDPLVGPGIGRHYIELEGGGFYRGIGLRLNGDWSAPTRVRGSGLPGSSDLRFGSTFKLQVRAFVNFDMKPKVLKSLPFLKGSRLALQVENIFDSRQRVTDATGAVPLSYQPDLIDPRGRVIELDFRKMF
ncbi:MAG: TonB-dependent receptor [Novosphingobium sp.]